MTALRNLFESAGFGERRSEVLVLVSGTSLLAGLLTFFTTQIAGLAICFSALTLVIWLEVLRAVSASRQKRMDFLWPAVFDALRSGSQAGLSMLEQIEYLASDGPEVFREQFALLASELERGVDTQAALAGFQRRAGSRSGDSLAIVMALVEEVGGRGEAANWEQAARDLRQEQAVISHAGQFEDCASCALDNLPAASKPRAKPGRLFGPRGIAGPGSRADLKSFCLFLDEPTGTTEAA
ncbi:MAG: hypothetical protein EBW70_05070 [Actinobacteria bacterium]|nr:hypothetical protein [Actinomycetota bacterium]